LTDIVVDPAAPAPDPAASPEAETASEPVANERYAQTTRAATETIIGTAIWSYLWAMILNATLNLMHNMGNFKLFFAYTLRHQFPVFALGAAVVWLIVLLLLCITGRLWLTCGLTLSIALGLGLVDQTKMRIRLEPVYPSDLDFLRSPGFLFAMVSPGRLILAAAALVLTTAVIMVLGRVPAKTFKPIRRHSTSRYWRNVMITRVTVGLACVLCLHYAASFNSSDNKLRHAFEASGVHWAFWYQDVNYRRNGFVAGMLYNLLAEPMSPPAGYSKKTMAAVAARWQAQAAKINQTRANDLDGVNVISVLSEAFSDPTTVHGTTVTGDPIPFTRDVMNQTTSGTMLAQLYGGGTANMEFETLSGQSLSVFDPQVNTPYQQFVHNQSSYPTIVGYLKARDHRPIAIHPYMTAMYQRKPVYKIFGFDEFIHDSTMHETEKIGRNKFISDQSAFDEVTRQIDQNDTPLFVNLVTMQNHVPTSGKYKDPWPVRADNPAASKSLGGYTRGINYSDQALQRFLAHLSASKEKTAVLFYGDHRPGIYTSKITDQNTDVNMKTTPFFIWTNFKTPRIPTAAKTSPIYFMPLLFEQLGAKVPAYYALLTEMYQQIPAMEQDVRYDWAGNAETKLDPAALRMLHDYRLVQYDLSVGKRYSASAMFYPLHPTTN